jgi:hypothetical protein
MTPPFVCLSLSTFSDTKGFITLSGCEDDDAYLLSIDNMTVTHEELKVFTSVMRLARETKLITNDPIWKSNV